MSEQRAQTTTGGGDDDQRTQAFAVGDGLTVDLRKPDDAPWRTASPDAGEVPPAGVTRARGDDARPDGTSADDAVAPAGPAADDRGRTETSTPESTAPSAQESTAQEASGQESSRTAASVPPRPDGAQARAVPTRSTLPRTGGSPQRVRPGAPAATGGGGGGARARRARLRLARIDPWSVLLLSLLVSLFLAVVVVVAVVALYAVLEAAGVPDSVNALVAEVTRTPGEAEPEPLLSAGRALRAAGVLAVVDVILLTALSTLSAVLYNLCASFTGGLEVTLAEDA